VCGWSKAKPFIAAEIVAFFAFVQFLLEQVSD
jgi:hypothetical protein